MGHQQIVRLLQRRGGLISCYCRKMVEKLVQRITSGQIVEQGPNGNSSPHKNRSAAENVRIAVNDVYFGGHGLQSPRDDYTTRAGRFAFQSLGKPYTLQSRNQIRFDSDLPKRSSAGLTSNGSRWTFSTVKRSK